MNPPLMTVVTLCYNHEPFLDDYFNGLLSQTYDNVQLIIHDDCSTDRSWEMIQDYLPLVSAKFTEVICERSEVNLGMWKSFLRVVDPSRIQGKYLSLLESDDYYFPERLERVVDYLETHPDIGFVHSATVHIWHGSSRIQYHTPDVERVSGWVFERLLDANFANQCSIAFRSEIFNQIDIDKIMQKNYKLVDYAVNLAAARITEWGYIDDVLAVYRVRSGSASNPKDAIKKYEFGKSILQVAVDAATEASVAEDVMYRVFKKYHYSVFRGSVIVGEFKDFENSLRWLRDHSPTLLNSTPDRIRIWFFTKHRLREVIRAIYYNRLATKVRKKVSQYVYLSSP